MNKASLALLERAFTAEVEQAITKQGSGLLHTKAKLAKQLAEEGYLYCTEISFGENLVMSAYSLTHLGRLTYCMQCGEDDDK